MSIARAIHLRRSTSTVVSAIPYRALRVVIVRDRAGCGGGIHALFEALEPYLESDVRWVDVGHPHAYYCRKRPPWWQQSRLRWLVDNAALVLAILRHRPSLVHLNSGLDKEERALKRDAVNLWIARALGCQVLVQWHGWDHSAAGSSEFPGGNYGWLCRTYRNAVGHIVLASAFRDDLQRWGFDRIHLGRTVVASEILEAAEIGVKGLEPPQLLFLSRVERAKGLWDLLEAYGILKLRQVSCRLVIAGDGPDLAELQARAVEMGWDDVFFPGFVTGTAKIDCFRQASIFCFPSYSEGMPLAVLEAMAMGLPVVATPAGALADILRDGENGFLVPLGKSGCQPFRVSPGVLADRIALLLSDPDLRMRMGEMNRQETKQHFSPIRVADSLETIYNASLRR